MDVSFAIPTEKKCSGCKDVLYCSIEYQKEHWRIHKKECLKLKQSRLNQSFEAVSRIIYSDAVPWL